VHDERDPFFENLARELKNDPVTPAVDSRIMSAIRRTGMARWPALLMPRRLTITPLPWSILATTVLLLAAFLGAKIARAGIAPEEVEGFFDGDTQRVQFVLVRQGATSVTVLGDFNAWDRANTKFQAHNIGGGVWTVTAPVPIGHHRYSFLVDDSVWVADPNAPSAYDHDFGVPKSALVVRAGK
jgi:hypothetical protein